MQELVLENEVLRAVFSGMTGALETLTSKKSDWLVTRRPELGLSLRMLVPLEGRRNNQVLGEKQAAPDATRNADGSLAFTWRKVRSEHGGAHDITFTGTVSLTEYGLTFGGVVENHSGLTVETVSWPCLGDVTAPGPENTLTQLSAGYGGMSRTPLLPSFHNHRGYYGVDHPITSAQFPRTPFILADSGKQGLYVGCHDQRAAMMVAFSFELKPGHALSESENDGTVPVGDEIDGHKVRIEFQAIHFPFFNAGESGALQPIVLKPYLGTWHKGADNYRAWRRTWFKRHPAPAWVKDVHSWQQYHMNSPEDELRTPYKNLVKYGEDCAKHGVKAIQLVGWNNGGQDRGNPAHDTDPRLGTWQDLKDAIARIEAMGVHPILFNKYTWSDRSLEWFRKELVQHAMKDPYGDYHVYGGYQYQTPVQLMDINTRRLIPMCHHCQAWRDIACREFKKSIDLGASGMLFDESQHHGGAQYCWDAAHGHHVPAYIYGAGDARLEEDFHQLAASIKSDYLFAGEANYDLQFRNYHLSYFRINSRNHVPFDRYVDPEVELMIAVTGFDDRLMANRALMHRYIMSYEPFNFKGRLDDFPRTLAYGKKVDALRARYREFLWDAEYRDTQDATVTVKKAAHPHYTVFKAKSGKIAIVVANFDDKRLRCTVALEGVASPRFLAVTPEKPKGRLAGDTVNVQPASVVVMIQQ
jgi:hypothetical protein